MKCELFCKDCGRVHFDTTSSKLNECRYNQPYKLKVRHIQYMFNGMLNI